MRAFLGESAETVQLGVLPCVARHERRVGDDAAVTGHLDAVTRHWEGVTRLGVAQMRMHNANNPGDAEPAALVGELSRNSPSA